MEDSLHPGPEVRTNLNVSAQGNGLDGKEESSSNQGIEPRSTIDHEDDARAAMGTVRDCMFSEISEDVAADVRSWNELDSYINELCSHGLDKLSREPDALIAEGLRLRLQLEDVSCSNYRALIQSFECAGAVRDGVGTIRSCLDGLVDALPRLAATTREFSVTGSVQQNLREKRLRTLAEYGHVADLLEMPKLMRSLLSEELYDEALELRDMSLKLVAMHPDEPLLLSVCSEIDALTRQMILQLLTSLRGHVQLPTCLRVIGFLRRLSLFSELTLRALFLQCRGDWMDANLDSATGSNSQARLVRLSDDTRSMMFEIITQYRAAFAEDGDVCTQSDTAVPTAAILYDWTASHVSQYMANLKDGLRDVRDGASLSTVMQQAMYCGQSLGRVGADFRPVLVPMFEAALMKIVNFHLNAALRQFEVMIEDQRWAPVGMSSVRKDRSVLGDHTLADVPSARADSSNMDSEPSMGSGHGNAKIESFDPPENVLDSPALAVFTNGLLASLNELRSCALISVSTLLAQRMSETLVGAAESMDSVAGPGGAFLKRTDRPHFYSMHASLRDLCVPHIARCLDHCLDQSGLIDVPKLHKEMAEIFGDPLLTTVETNPHGADRDRASTGPPIAMSEAQVDDAEADELPAIADDHDRKDVTVVAVGRNLTAGATRLRPAEEGLTHDIAQDKRQRNSDDATNLQNTVV
jgi:conserved oligomeric Golgi complex subunit 8